MSVIRHLKLIVVFYGLLYLKYVSTEEETTLHSAKEVVPDPKEDVTSSSGQEDEPGTTLSPQELATTGSDPNMTTQAPEEGQDPGLTTLASEEKDNTAINTTKKSDSNLPTTGPTTLQGQPTPSNNFTTPSSNLTTLSSNVTTPPKNLTTQSYNLTTPNSNLTTPSRNLTTLNSNLTTPTNNFTTPTSNITTPSPVDSEDPKGEIQGLTTTRGNTDGNATDILTTASGVTVDGTNDTVENNVTTVVPIILNGTTVTVASNVTARSNKSDSEGTTVGVAFNGTTVAVVSNGTVATNETTALNSTTIAVASNNTAHEKTTVGLLTVAPNATTAPNITTAGNDSDVTATKAAAATEQPLITTAGLTTQMITKKANGTGEERTTVATGNGTTGTGTVPIAGPDDSQGQGQGRQWVTLIFRGYLANRYHFNKNITRLLQQNLNDSNIKVHLDTEQKDNVTLVCDLAVERHVTGSESVSSSQLLDIFKDNSTSGWKSIKIGTVSFVCGYQKSGPPCIDLPLPPIKEKLESEGLYEDNKGLFISIFVLGSLCVLVIIIGLIYIRCRQGRTETYVTHSDSVKLESARLSNSDVHHEVNNPIPDKEILRDEMETTLTHNGAPPTVEMEEGWIVPLDQI